MLKVKTTH